MFDKSLMKEMVPYEFLYILWKIFYYSRIFSLRSILYKLAQEVFSSLTRDEDVTLKRNLLL